MIGKRTRQVNYPAFYFNGNMGEAQLLSHQSKSKISFGFENHIRIIMPEKRKAK